MDAERRCQRCGALVAADAAWCGQCWATLEPAGARPEGAGAVITAVDAETVFPAREVATDDVPRRGRRSAATWPCPTCGNANPIELNLCGSCGTPFGRLFEVPGTAPEVEPRTAALLSLALPGLGQWRSGRQADAVCRMIAFAFPFGTMLLLIVSRLGRGGLGSTAALFTLFLLATLAAWATAVVDAYRMAAGVRPLLSPKVLLWGLVALIAVTVGLASAIALPAIHRR